MIEKIGRRTAFKSYPSLPTANWRTQVFQYPYVFNTYILTVSNGTRKNRLKKVIGGLSTLLEKLGINELIFMGDTSTPWLFRSLDDKEAQTAQNYLIAAGINKTFSGGFRVKVNELSTFMYHTFWLTRINAVSFDLHFVDTDQTIVCHPCKEWNLHFSTRTEVADSKFKRELSSSGLTIIDRCG